MYYKAKDEKNSELRLEAMSVWFLSETELVQLNSDYFWYFEVGNTDSSS